MKAIVYFPKSDNDKTELMQKVATVHAEAVVTKLNSFSLTKEKFNLHIDEIKANLSIS